MPQYDVLIFAANNLTNPQNPGFLPREDNTFASDLVNGNQITWNGGGEARLVTINDPNTTTFDEAQSNQTLVNPVTFNGISYLAGQVVTPTYTILFSGSDGNNYVLTSFNFSPNTNNEIPDALFWEGAIPPAGTVLTVTSEQNPTGSAARDYTTFVTCFCAGTLIGTRHGPRPVETLKKGDRIRTQSGEMKEVLLATHRRISPDALRMNPKLRPVKISKGALGHGLPSADIWVSRQHRFQVSSPVCQRMFGADRVLVSAIQLTPLPDIYVDDTARNVSYHHILLAGHEIIYANDTPTESLHLGEATLATMSPVARREVFTIFPDLVQQWTLVSPHLMPDRNRQKTLVRRHLKNKMGMAVSV
jgi:hypothetical protein